MTGNISVHFLLFIHFFPRTVYIFLSSFFLYFTFISSYIYILVRTFQTGLHIEDGQQWKTIVKRFLRKRKSKKYRVLPHFTYRLLRRTRRICSPRQLQRNRGLRFSRLDNVHRFNSWPFSILHSTHSANVTGLKLSRAMTMVAVAVRRRNTPMWLFARP